MSHAYLTHQTADFTMRIQYDVLSKREAELIDQHVHKVFSGISEGHFVATFTDAAEILVTLA